MSDLPRGWAEARLTDIINLHDSDRVPLNKEQRQQRQGPYPYYGANGLVDHIDDYLFDGDYVLLAEDGGYFDDPARGVAYEASGKFWVNNHAHIVSPRGEIPNRFLTHLLNAIEWLPYVGGSTRLKLTQAGMQQVPVPVPPAPEQRRIVAKLDALRSRSSRARQELDHIPKLIERYKQAILSKAFSGELTKEWRQEHGMPKWDDTTIGEVGEVMLGRQRSPANHNGPHMRSYVRAANITWHGWDLSDVKVMNFDEPDFARFKLEPGDVLINEGSGSAKEVGKPAIWGGQINDCCFQNTLIRVRPIRCTSEFLHRYIYWCARSEQFVSSTQGVNIYHIGKEGLAKFPMKLPHREEQIELVRLVDVALAWLDKITTEHARAEHLLPKLDQAILAKAFRGELVPQDPNDEPASILLERIAGSRIATPAKKRK